MSDQRTMNAVEIKAGLKACFAVKQPAFIWGSPGIGKSELVAGIAEEMNGTMIDLRLGQMEMTDLKGIPFFNKETNKMEWAPSEDLPDEELAKDWPNIVLFLDEMNTASPSVLASAYQLILDRRIGKYKLPDNVVVVAAGNKESDKGVTFRMPTPLSNRFVHFEMKVHFDSWFDWAVDNNIHEDIVGYLNFAKQDLYDFDPKSSTRAFATPRSWTFVSDLISQEGLDKNTITNLVAGTVGQGMALKFIAHRKLAGKLPNPMDILEGKVTTLETTEISAKYSLVISMCYQLKDSLNNGIDDKEFHKMADNFFGFMMKNFEVELNVLGARIGLTKYKLPIFPTKLKNFDEFHKRYGKFILAASD